MLLYYSLTKSDSLFYWYLCRENRWRRVYVGTGAKIINQLEIGEYTIVVAGAVVSKTLPAHCTAVGVPAKPIKFHE